MIQQLKNILCDLGFLYKNFVHWNISKILIQIFSFLLGVLFSLPFIIIVGIFVYFDPISWNEVLSNYYNSGALSMLLMAEVYSHFGYLLVEAFLLFLGFVGFIVGFSYKNITFAQLYLSYTNKERLPYFSNIYFQMKKIWAYFKLFLLVALVLLIPVVVFVIAFFILIFAFGGVDSVFSLLDSGEMNMFSITLGVVFFLCALVFIYLAYRMSFSYIILIDRQNYPETSKASQALKASFQITSGWKIAKFLLLIILFTLVMMPFDYLGEYVQQKHDLVIAGYNIFLFLVFGGLFEMFVVSIYKRIMIASKTPPNMQESPEENLTQEVL